jgi:hypothetical protein
MSTMPSHTQSESFAASLLVEPSAEAHAVRPLDLKNDRFPSGWAWLGQLAALAFIGCLIAFFTGVIATLAWQSYGDAAREVIAPAASSPARSKLIATSLDLDAVRQSIDTIAAGFAASQEQMKRSVDQLAAAQNGMTRDFDSRLRAVEQNILDKIAMPPAMPPSRSAPAPARSPVRRASEVPMVRSGIP